MADTPVNRLFEAATDNTATSATSSIADGSVVVVTLMFWSTVGQNLASNISSTLAMKTIADEEWHLHEIRSSEWNNWTADDFGGNNLKIQQLWGVKDGAGTGTVTVNTTQATGFYVSVDEVVGGDPNYPIRQHEYTGNATGGTGITDTLPFTPLSSSQLISGSSSRDHQSGTREVSPDTGWQNTTTGGEADGQRHIAATFGAAGSNGTGYGYSVSEVPTAEQGAAIGVCEIRDDLGGLPEPNGLAIFQRTLTTSTHATASISPTSSDSLVCVRIVFNDATSAKTVSSISLGGTLVMTDALAEVADSGTNGTRDVRTVWWVGRYASGSGALTINMSATTSYVGAQVVEITSSSIDFADPVGATEVTGGASILNNVLAAGTLDATPADTSTILASFAAYGNANFGPADAEDSRYRFWGIDVASQDEGDVQTNFLVHNSGEVGTNLGGYFGDDATDQTGGWALAAIEIKVAAAGGGSPLTFQPNSTTGGMASMSGGING